jgi:hypothetical protein
MLMMVTTATSDDVLTIAARQRYRDTFATKEIAPGDPDLIVSKIV